MTKGATEPQSSVPDGSNATLIDPRGARFGQIITATLLTAAIVVQEPLLVLTIAVILGASVLSDWRLDLYSILWRQVVVPLVGTPMGTEPAAPHRFAKLMGAFFTALATLLLVTAPLVRIPEFAWIGYAIAGLIALLAGISGVGDYCLGCKMYEQVSFFRRLDVI